MMMRRVDTPETLAVDVPDIVIAAGFFDGVHLGHRRILSTTCAAARARGAEAWVLTFDPHPLAVVAPSRKPPLLTRLELRLERLAETGMDGCLLLPFTPGLAALSAAAFVDHVFGGWMSPGRHCTVVSGGNWRFGQDRAGDLRMLTTATAGAIATIEVPLEALNGHRVSSSFIREAIRKGALEHAQAMLGAPYVIRERAIPGRGLGSRIGFATANFHPQAEVLPPTGVYVVDARLLGREDRRWLRGVANFGTNPTVGQGGGLAEPLLEVHLLDFSGDLHGEEMDVRFLRRLRDERWFPSMEALAAQIARDVEAARRE